MSLEKGVLVCTRRKATPYALVYGLAGISDWLKQRVYASGKFSIAFVSLYAGKTSPGSKWESSAWGGY